MCRNVCTHLCAGTCGTGRESDRSINYRHVFKAQGSRKKVNVLASLFPALKITPRAKELFNDKYRERLRPRPTPSPIAQCQAKPKINLPYGWVGKPQANKEMRAREPTEQYWQAGAGREACYLHRAHPARVGPRCARAREREHTHPHGRIFVGTPRAIPHQAQFNESLKQVCPWDNTPVPNLGDSHSIPPAWGNAHQVGKESRNALHGVFHSAARFCIAAEKRKEKGECGDGERLGGQGRPLRRLPPHCGQTRSQIPRLPDAHSQDFPAAYRPRRLPGKPHRWPCAEPGNPHQHPPHRGRPGSCPGGHPQLSADSDGQGAFGADLESQGHPLRARTHTHTHKAGSRDWTSGNSSPRCRGAQAAATHLRVSRSVRLSATAGSADRVGEGVVGSYLGR